jgi:predicted O-linked N-acetylglucosamine transferase (SPINDLY family)
LTKKLEDKVTEAFADLPLTELLKYVRGFEDKGVIEGAINAYRTWLVRNANSTFANHAWLDYGRLLQKIGNIDKAVFAYLAALEQNSTHTEAALALGYLLEGSHKFNEAIEVWRRCIDSGGDQPTLLNNIGRVYDSCLYQYELAELALMQSLKINSDQRDVISTLFFIRQRLCSWPVLPPEIKTHSQEVSSYFGPIASLAFFNDPVKNLESARAILRDKGVGSVTPLAIEKRKKTTTQKIKVGFLSADFRLHATSVFFTAILAKLDREIFEVYALDITVQKDPFGAVRQIILEQVDRHIPLQLLDDDAAVELIRSCDLDILIDMAGLTAAARPLIVAKRVAPVQISYLGFIGSSGIESVDYILTSSDMFLEQHRSGYTEKPLFLHGAYVVMGDDLIEYGQQMSTRAQCGLPEDKFVYCALVNSYKITPEVYDSWLNILSQVENSVLWLLGEQQAIVKNLIEYAAKKGIDADRIVFLSGRVHPVQFRAHLRCADLFLDTSPYGNGATAREAILAGLPILSCPGNTMMSRFSAHLMSQLDMKDFVVNSRDEYEKFAITLGRYPELLESYKRKMSLACKTSDLFNADLFVKDFGRALLQAYKS